MKTIRLSCSHSLVRFLIAQKIMIDGEKMPLFAGAFGIYGHGNVACIGQAMEEYQNELPGYRGHHEQNMALTGIGYARAMRRKQIFVATSSIGPGATNMITAAAVALSNRLPILLLPEILLLADSPIRYFNRLKISLAQLRLKMILLKRCQNILIALHALNKYLLLFHKQFK